MTSPQYTTAPPAAPVRETPLWAPLYGASPVQAVQRFFKKYADFTGRASRSEFWWWYLFNVIALFGGGIVMAMFSSGGATVNHDGSTSPGPTSWLLGLFLMVWTLGTIVPQIALMWRRFHDGNRSGLFVVLGFIPSWAASSCWA